MTVSDDNPEQQQGLLVDISLQQLLRVAIVGLIVGVVTWGLALLLDTYVLKSIAGPSLAYANAISSIVAGGLALFALVKLQVFRSLLVVIAATICLWGLETTLHAWPWQYALFASALLFAAAYSLFVWLARIRSFLMAVIVMVVLVVVVRLILNS